jgi:hypothetical protein
MTGLRAYGTEARARRCVVGHAWLGWIDRLGGPLGLGDGGRYAGPRAGKKYEKRKSGQIWI